MFHITPTLMIATVAVVCALVICLAPVVALRRRRERASSRSVPPSAPDRLG
ncbi:hypothetical protein LJR045_002779 [Microbacterium sp. LjRoot45]|uniref:hypothetical protein n=1 Tax=Microbacterium sp. LjRoot45 TaxID=3342329 RepID=UPI003ECFA0B9